MHTVKGAETKVLPSPSPSPIFLPACRKLWFYSFSSDKPHNCPAVPDLGLQKRPAASVKLAAARYFQAGGVECQLTALSEQLKTPSRATVYGNTDLCHRQGKHWASVGPNIYRPLRSSPGKRDREGVWEKSWLNWGQIYFRFLLFKQH